MNLEKSGIERYISDYISDDVEPIKDAKTFLIIHDSVTLKIGALSKDELLSDSVKMAKIQHEFYDEAAILYQQMDDRDKKIGGVHWMRRDRICRYDAEILKGKTNMLYIGAGNCRHARWFAQHGFKVTATDISFNILKVGKEVNDRLGVDMRYIQHNAEEPFVYAKDEEYDCCFSNCTANHIVNWVNFFGEQLRVLKPGGILLCRMPNADLRNFWAKQGKLEDGVEVKAPYCNTESSRKMFKELSVEGETWTHDRQLTIIPIGFKFAIRQLKIRLHIDLYKLAELILYRPRTLIEDRRIRLDNGKGIYTMIKIMKPARGEKILDK